MKIDKGIIPDPTPPRRMKYPWLQLGVGDSFEVDIPLTSAKDNAHQASVRYKRKFQAGISKGRVRIWRWA
jgi:hypothetical protein